MLLLTVAGGASPHSSSIRRSLLTTSLACSSSMARSARCLPPPSASDVPCSTTSTGPSTRNSIITRSLRADRTSVRGASTGRHPSRLPRARTLRPMSHRLFTHTAAVGLAVAAVSAPVAAGSVDLRSPDAVDAARAAAVHNTQDLRSPDTRDNAAGRGTFNAPRVTVVRVAQPSQVTSGGFDWGDAGIGAGGVLALVLIAVGGSLMVTHRRHRGPA